MALFIFLLNVIQFRVVTFNKFAMFKLLKGRGGKRKKNTRKGMKIGLRNKKEMR